jgi:hypothetical protein
MHNHLLLNEAYNEIDLNLLQNNLYLLNELLINKRKSENFHLNNSLYSHETTIGIFSELIFAELPDQQFRNTTLPRLLNSLRSIDYYPITETELDAVFKSSINGFYGVNFNELNITETRQIIDKQSYNSIKYNFELISTENFWNNKSTYFDRIDFCVSIEECKDYFLSLPNANAIIERLKSIELYYIQNGDRSFNFDDFLDKTGLNCSTESKSTLQQFSKERAFTLSDGRTIVFSWHIKIGDVRVYFHSEDSKTYISYIGVHLPTKKFKK